MPSLKSKTLALLLLSSFALNAEEIPKVDESILSKDRLELFNLEKKQVEEDSSKLKKDWINSINYTYYNTNGESGKSYDYERSYISIDQPIFKSGGIYQAIKYANALKLYSNLDIEAQKKALIKDTTTLLFQIHKLQYQIEKQEYLVKNGEIDIQRKKEQVLNGFADTSLLDNAILDTNSAKNSLAELIYQKTELINQFNNYASGEFNSFKLPTLKLLNEDKYIENNLNISKAQASIESSNNYSWMTIAKYLPTVSATFDYTKYHDTNNTTLNYDNVTNYGFKITVPFDVKTFNDVESKRIDYLKAKLNFQNIITEEKNYFKNKLAKIKMIDSKISIAKNDFELYDSLLQVIIEEKNAEIKTQSDVDILFNSKKIRELDLKIYQLDKQIELLEMFSKIS